MAEPIITCIEDLRVLAKRRVPKMFYDYADSGAWTESFPGAGMLTCQTSLPMKREWRLVLLQGKCWMCYQQNFLSLSAARQT